MTGKNVLDLVTSQNGKLTQDQYLCIFEHSPNLVTVFYDENGEYEFELVFDDIEDTVFCNVVVQEAL